MKKICTILLFAAALCWANAAVAFNNYLKSVRLTLNQDLTTTEIADVPALVRISETSIPGFAYSDLNDDASDIIFLDENNNILPHEIDTWNTAGESLIWVKLPSTAAGTVFRMYWGNNIVAGSTASDVWSNYVGVWHLGESGEANAVTTLADSTANGYDGVNIASANCHSNANGKIGSAWQIATAVKSGTGGIAMSSMADVELGTQFTISAWCYHAISSYNYDHLYYRKNGSQEAGGFAIEVANTAKTSLHTRGSGSTCATLTIPTTSQTWAHIAIAYDGTTVYSVGNGSFLNSGTIVAPTDNGLDITFGTDSNKNDTCTWAGSMDEIRVRKGAYDANYLTAEYNAMNVGESDIFTFGEVTVLDATNPILAVPTAIISSDSSVFVSIEISDNIPAEGSVKAVVNGNEYLMSTTDSSLPQTYTVTIPAADLSANTSYTCSVKCTSAGGTELVSEASDTFYYGTLSVVKTTDADESTGASGFFQISRADAGADLAVNYTLSGDAVAGTDYEAISSSVTIPAGETSVTIEVTPIFNNEKETDASLILTITDGSYILSEPAPSAEVTIVNASFNAYVRYVSATEGSDDNTGFTASNPKATIQAALDDLVSYSQEKHCTVYVADGVYASSDKEKIVAITNSISVIGNNADPARVVISNSNTSAGSMRRVVHMNHAEGFLSGVTLAKGNCENNSSYGGNLTILGNGGTVSNCVITAGHGNQYNSKTGNAYLSSANALVTHCRITKGTISTIGGGSKGANVYMTKGRIENSLITDASESFDGAVLTVTPGVYISGGSLVNCTIANNSGSACGGVYVGSTSAKIKNCVIAGNEVKQASDGNRAAYAPQTDAIAAIFENCLLDTSFAPNSTCFNAPTDAIFANLSACDYTLAVGSLGIDGGATLENAPTLDLAGASRIMNDVIDMGCYESYPDAMAIAFYANVSSGIVPLDVTFTAVASGFGDNVTYAWDFNADGTVDAETTSPTYTYSGYTAGTYSVTLIVSGSNGTKSVTKSQIITIAAKTLYVDAASTSPTFPYDSWDSAAKTIKEALSVAVDGCEIIVRAGTYKVTSAVDITKDVMLHSEENIPESVIIDGQERYKTLRLNSPKAFAYGLTLHDGHDNNNSGVAVTIGASGGTVSNCVIRNSSGGNWSGNVPAVYIQAGSGLVTHSVITNNTVSGQNNGTKYIINVGKGGRLENSLICNNYNSGTGNNNNASLISLSNGAYLRNNTIVDNTMENRGLLNISTGATVMNNVFANNTFIPSDGALSEGSYGATHIGFNFGSLTDEEFVNCAFDENCEYTALPNDSCVLGTAETFFTYYNKDSAAVDEDGNVIPNDYTPLPSGPLYNAGANYDSVAEVDLNGELRVNAGIIDIGAYEAPPAATIIIIR